jgi:hypothetical protein
VTLRALRREHSERFATALEMASALESALAPPATPSTVADWVSTLAGGMLETRLKHVRALMAGHAARAHPPPPIDTGVPADRRRRLLRTAIPLSCLVLGISLAIGAAGSRRRFSKHEVESSSAMEALRASAVSSDATFVVTPSAISPPIPPPPEGASAAPSVPSTPAAKQPKRPMRPTPAPSTDSCQTPYTLDKDGIRIPKLRCY